MLALEAMVFAEGLNVAVRVSPVPLMAVKVPDAKVTSPEVPFHVNELPGSSENVNVTKLVSVFDNKTSLMVILTDGAVVSTL